MTAVIRSAEARLSASTMISSSIRFSLVGAQVDCTTNTSRARTFVLISTVTSPSEKRLTEAAPRPMPRWPATSSANAGLALPVNTMKSGVGAACMKTTFLDPNQLRTEHASRGLSRNVKTTCLAGEEGLEPSHAGIKIQCLNQLGD